MKSNRAGHRRLLLSESLEPRRLLSASGLIDLATTFPQSQDNGNCAIEVYLSHPIQDSMLTQLPRAWK
jgi:hypothetical protein